MTYPVMSFRQLGIRNGSQMWVEEEKQRDVNTQRRIKTYKARQIVHFISQEDEVTMGSKMIKIQFI